MGFTSFALAIIAMALEATLLMRARQGRFLSQFPLFYSYLTYVLGWSLITSLLYFFMPQQYPAVFWFCFIVMLVAEFAVLLEGSDHIFKPYHPIRRLGRLLTLCICLTFLLVFIVPSLMRHQSSSVAMLDLVKMTSLTKAVLIIVMLGAARLYRLPLGKNISGMMLGFATYLAINIANIALDAKYGGVGYAEIFAIVGPLSFILALAIWNVALRRYEPVLPGERELERVTENVAEPLANRLGKYDNELTRFFRR